MPPGILLAGLFESIFSGFIPAVLAMLGVAGLVFGVVSVLQTRRWPRTETVRQEQKPEAPRPKKDEPRPEPLALRPATTTKQLKLAFPEIDEAHPDVWGTDHPLVVLVRVPTHDQPAGAALSARLSVHHKGGTRDLGVAGLDEDGVARFTAPLRDLGEQDLIAELLVNGQPKGQAVRSIRIVDYRNEIVETFEDFVAWAASHYPFVDRKMTAREFVDRYADGRPGTPVAPLETVVDLYELANYSEHPVDRRAYLDLVESFLELEQAGALEGPGGA